MKKLTAITVVLFLTCFSWVNAQEKQAIDDNATIVMTKTELDSFIAKIKELRKQRILKCQQNNDKNVTEKVVINKKTTNKSTSDDTYQLLQDLNNKVNQLLYRNNNSTTYVPLGSNTEVKNNDEYLKLLLKRIEDLEAKVNAKKDDNPNLNKKITELETRLSQKTEKPATIKEVKVIEVSKSSKYDELMKKYNNYKVEYFFQNNSSNVSITDYSSIKKIADIVMSETPHIKIQLKGFASKKGSLAYNVELSKRRAEAVSNAFVKEGVNPSFIEILPLGEDTMSSDSKARRVEVYLFIN